ncbi:MAG: hypothetical protein AABZ24_11575, partial [Nitrospirota bacterium]
AHGFIRVVGTVDCEQEFHKSLIGNLPDRRKQCRLQSRDQSPLLRAGTTVHVSFFPPVLKMVFSKSNAVIGVKSET